MYTFKIYGKEYKVRFTYRAICRGDVLDKFTDALNFKDLDAKGMLNQLVTVTAETLIAGLQKYHSDEFGYKDETERAELVDKVIDMFDDYEDESTGEHPQSAATLFMDLQKELETNGFLSLMAQTADEAETATQTAETIKAEMESESARMRVIDMTPSENKS